jgi:glycosyltransferase involved in cell wall biosynthesis
MRAATGGIAESGRDSDTHPAYEWTFSDGRSANAIECSAVHVVVVVPTYNEVDNIGPLCRRVRVALADADILIVDDGSPDGTANAARAIGGELGRIDVIDQTVKGGLGAAYRAGFREAIARGADICVQLDADLSHDPAALPALVANVEHGADLAIGSRYVPGGLTVDWPWQRRALSRWGNRYAAGVLGLAVNDATAGYRAYSTDALRKMDYETVTADGYGFQVEMTHRLVGIGGRIVEFPITFSERVAGESKLNKGIIGEALGLVMRLWLADLRGRRERRRQGG